MRLSSAARISNVVLKNGFQEAERKIPINYASRYTSRAGGLQKSAYLPFKVCVNNIVFILLFHKLFSIYYLSCPLVPVFGFELYISINSTSAEINVQVNSSGVMPIIFSTSSLALPGTLARFTGLGLLKKAAVALNPGGKMAILISQIPNCELS